MYYRSTSTNQAIKWMNNKKRRAHEREVLRKAEKVIDPDEINDIDLEKKEDPWAWD